MFDELNHKKITIIILSITNIISICFVLYFCFFNADKKEEIMHQEMIIVEIAGEVKYPDVYEIEYGARLHDLIELAGGFTDEANRNEVNRAKKLQDGTKETILNIYDKDEKININTADVEDLIKLRGIGETRAKAIIDYRELNGPFNSIEEIMRVTGIGESTFENIKDDIRC